MSKLLYITNTSLDGYIEDEAGAFDFGNPDQVFGFITELLRSIGTHLYGRRLYETMAYWDAPPEGCSPEHREFARIWQDAEKIVFSRTLRNAVSPNTRIEREFDFAKVRRLKAESQRDMIVGGAELAGLALEAGVVDECRLFVYPVIVGGGKPAFRTGLRRSLELLESRRLGTEVVYVRYAVRGGFNSLTTQDAPAIR